MYRDSKLRVSDNGERGIGSLPLAYDSVMLHAGDVVSN